MPFRISLLITTVALLAIPIAARAADAPAGKLIYNRDIRPILSDNCFHCHGNDKNKIKGKLRLNDRDAAIAKEAIVPGKPDESELVTRIFSKDVDDIMPPPESHKTLTDAQKATLKRWVAEGAEYQPHWAYIPLAQPELPKVKDAKWVRNAIDNFVLAELERRGMPPSPEADRRTLLRRLSLDLVGLPPTPAEVEAFVNDKSPNAYEKQVDRLLASRHFGERMAAPWLDAVRFSDTVGFHGDQNQNVFPYRDYVINALNANKPFDQFTVEQLAGDLLPKPTQEQLIASGFNRLNMMTREGGAQPKEYLAIYQADRVRTVSLAWLGSTFGCAECHDHKFDPISTRDFYAMGAFFADIRQWGVYSDYKYTPNPDLKGWNNDYPFPPEIKVDSPYLAARKARLEKQVDDLAVGAAKKLATDAAAKGAFEKWTAHAAFVLKDLVDDGFYEVPTAVSGATKLVEDYEGGKFATYKGAGTGKAGPTVEVVLKPAAEPVAAIRLTLAGDLLKKPLTAAGPAIRLAASIKPEKGAVRKIGIYHADADQKEPRYSSTEEVIGVQSGWVLSAKHLNKRQTSTWLLDPPVRLAKGETLLVSIVGQTALPMNIAVSPIAPADARTGKLDPATKAAILAKPSERTAAQQALLARAYLTSTAADAETFAKYKQLHREILECRDGKAWQQVTVAVPPMTTRVLPRGNWQDESGPVVPPETPHFLPGLPDASGRRLSRIDLAKWIVSEQNPLTARAITNRFWKMFFGAGLSASVEDLGFQGEWPSHPELLDWLAAEFRSPENKTAHRWDVKYIVRKIVTSSTYRQASNLRPELRDVDPQNRLLSAQSPRRLEAEFVRDNALFAAGLLNLADIGGPSVKPYQPEDYYAALQFPDRVYTPHADDRQYRRGVYMHWQRTFLHPMLANFDAPSREDSVCTRVVSNTPQQALTLLNDPEFVEASRVLAEKLLAAGGSDEQKIDRLFQRVLSRLPKDRERTSLTKFLAGQRQTYKAMPQDAEKLLTVGNSPASGPDAAELAAWANTCRVVLNLHEAITRY